LSEAANHGLLLRLENIEVADHISKQKEADSCGIAEKMATQVAIT